MAKKKSKKKPDIEGAVDAIVGPAVAFKPMDITTTSGKTIGYSSNVPTPATIKPNGFSQVGLFRIDTNKNAKLAKKRKLLFNSKVGSVVDSLLQ